MSDKPNKPAKPAAKKVAIDIPKDLKPVYGNLAFITHKHMEFFIDFAQIMPHSPRGSLVSRVIMSPMHAKLLHNALATNLANYERQYGQIKLPGDTIADQFFGFTEENKQGD
ncbi:MAG: DUF3467 domain-containing protein [Chloroflexota bacterium]